MRTTLGAVGRILRMAGAACAVTCLSCGGGGQETARLRLATTTSTENSGLLEVLLPPFERQTGIEVDIIAVGTGKAIALGENGDVDAILVHDRAREDQFVAQGYGVNRRDVMHNDFVVLGPESDPAGIAGSTDAAEAFAAIAAAEATFVSRGDESGTHAKEKSLWRAAEMAPTGDWYLEAGQGMGATLTIADEKRAYTLADRGTFIAFRDQIDLGVLCEGDPRLHNPYGVIAVNPERHPHVHHEAALQLSDYLTSATGQRIIGEFTREGEPLFVPDAVP